MKEESGRECERRWRSGRNRERVERKNGRVYRGEESRAERGSVSEHKRVSKDTHKE